MLDFAQLATPARHGDVLAVPATQDLAPAVRASHAVLAHTEKHILGRPLSHWRARIRRQLAGTDDTLLVVTGHQPAFIHPGVWAKHVVTQRLAEAVDGMALNLVVDTDAPSTLDLKVPHLRDKQVELREIPFAQLPPGCVFAQIPPHTESQQRTFTESVQAALGARYADSPMPDFFEGFARCAEPGSWVEQAVAGRKAVEAQFGVQVRDLRVSTLPFTPLLADLLTNAEHFATSYNRALNWYRREFKVRGRQRPIPDLVCVPERCEVAAWAYRNGEPRRRLFVTPKGDATRTLWAEQTEIGTVELAALEDDTAAQEALSTFSDWHFAPRALTLMLWTRLLLADLFIHGIGGAKYDRITDRLIEDYYETSPPAYACVSATLRLDLPIPAVSEEDVARHAHALRDSNFNPQRHLSACPEIADLLREREEAVCRARELALTAPRDRAARREAFTRIRALNQALLELHPGVRRHALQQLEQTRRQLQQYRIAGDREYFFGLHDRRTLEQLTAALPKISDIRV